MNTLKEHVISCPYCGELLDILIDISAGDESYVEDCKVCCRPIEISVFEDVQGELIVQISDENEI
ncbi:MAG TPA: CPXCG motif-containing cysteine-rich protein [Leucothrix mucor]|nr:CPXCG motif-containing cysteine-rich protein [Leucothrix mucor]